MALKAENYEKLGYNISELYHFIRESRIIEELRSASEYYRKMDELERDIDRIRGQIHDKEHSIRHSSDRENRLDMIRESTHLQREWKTKVQNLHFYKRHLKKARVTKSLIDLRKKMKHALSFR